MQVPDGWKVQSKPVARSRKKKPKYNNKRIEFQGMKFDSKKELKRYLELKDLEKRGLISDLELQIAFELAPSVKLQGEDRAKPALRYVADFVYMLNDVKIIEDVKSAITRKNDVYRIKKHLMKHIHNIDISEY